MNIILDWYEPIVLGSSSGLRDNLIEFDFSIVPQTAGIYFFFREYGKYKEALYIGRSQNIRKRIQRHFKNIKLIDSLVDTKNGKKKLAFCKVVTQGNLHEALVKSEKILINNLDGLNHPLLNRQLMRNQYDYILSQGKVVDIINKKISVFCGAKNNLSDKDIFIDTWT